MSEHAHAQSSATPAVASAHADAQGVIGGQMQSVDAVIAQREAERAGTELMTVKKTVALQQALAHAQAGIALISQATADAMEDIEEPELPKTDVTWELLTIAGSTAIISCGGPLAASVVGAFSSIQKFKEATAKTASDLAVLAFKKAMGKPALLRAASMKALKTAFRDTIHKQQDAASQRFVAAWEPVATHLAFLPDDDLTRLNAALAAIDVAAQRQTIMRMVMVAWTNFLAQAKHGAMRGWDPWAENGSQGALKTKGAEAPPASGERDPTGANVAAGRLGWAFKNTQRGGLDEHFGLLEVFVYKKTHGLVGASGYGMRLDNVGPKVRAELREMGRVRDLKVNKLVRVCSNYKDGMYLDPPVIVGGVVITADGYIRRNEMSAPVHFEQKQPGSLLDPTGFGKCADNIIHGKESSDCHLQHDVSDAEAKEVAEAAQDLPLTFLEV